MSNILKKFFADYENASEMHEQYMRNQVFFKGQFSERHSVSDFMQLDYLPKLITKILKICRM